MLPLLQLAFRRMGSLLAAKPEQVAPARAASLEAPVTPLQKDAKRRQGRAGQECHLLELPQELAEHILHLHTEVQDLCALAQTCTRLRALSEGSQAHWRGLFADRFGPVTELQAAAAKLAGGWHRLYAARHTVEKESTPWSKPTQFEVDAAVRRLAAGPAGEPREAPLCLVFLVDGSGSVTEDDFSCMTQFMQTAVNSIAAAGHPSKVAVLQFSNDVREEQGAKEVDVEGFAQLMQNMHRMNGGTNISLAVQRAGQLLKPLGEDCRRVLVLLTDGRVDSHQAREAHDMARRLADEQPNVDLWAFGVGRGVDRQELLHIISAKDPDAAEGRYLGLCVLDEAPW